MRLEDLSTTQRLALSERDASLSSLWMLLHLLRTSSTCLSLSWGQIWNTFSFGTSTCSYAPRLLSFPGLSKFFPKPGLLPSFWKESGPSGSACCVQGMVHILLPQRSRPHQCRAHHLPLLGTVFLPFFPAILCRCWYLLFWYSDVLPHS